MVLRIIHNGYYSLIVLILKLCISIILVTTGLLGPIRNIFGKGKLVWIPLQQYLVICHWKNLPQDSTLFCSKIKFLTQEKSTENLNWYRLLLVLQLEIWIVKTIRQTLLFFISGMISVIISMQYISNNKSIVTTIIKLHCYKSSIMNLFNN